MVKKRFLAVCCYRAAVVAVGPRRPIVTLVAYCPYCSRIVFKKYELWNALIHEWRWRNVL